MAKQQPTPNPAHAIHTDATGRWAWTAEHGLYRLAAPLEQGQRFGALHELNGQPVTAPDQNGTPAPLPVVVLRCRCKDPLGHAKRNEHCPETEVDVGDTMGASLDFHQVTSE